MATESKRMKVLIVEEPFHDGALRDIFDLYDACNGSINPDSLDIRLVEDDAKEADADQLITDRLRKLFFNLRRRKSGDGGSTSQGTKGGQEPVLPDKMFYRKYFEWRRRKEQILFFVWLSLFCSWFVCALYILLRDPQMSLRAAAASALFWALMKLFRWMSK